MPDEGARIRVDLLDAEGTRARYRVRVFTGGGEFEGVGRLEGRTATIEGLDGVSEGLRGHALAILRQAAGRAKDGRWPRRMMRWRTD